MHDPRIGRFFACDPLEAKYPHNSPYAFSENMVIHMVELEGLEAAPSGSESSSSSQVHEIEDYDKFGFTGKIITNSPRMTPIAADGISTVQIAKGSDVLFVNTRLESSVISPGGYTNLVYSIDYNSSNYTWNAKEKWYTNDKGESYPDPHWMLNAGKGIAAPMLNMAIGDGFQKMKDNAAKADMSLGDYMVSQMASGIAQSASDIWAGGHRGDIAWAQLWMTTPMPFESALAGGIKGFSSWGLAGLRRELAFTYKPFVWRGKETTFSVGLRNTVTNQMIRFERHRFNITGLDGPKVTYTTHFNFDNFGGQKSHYFFNPIKLGIYGRDAFPK